MALSITDRCINCWACLSVCPNQAIAHVEGLFVIDPQRCSECLGDYPVAQCASICPAEGAIENEWGEALNPPGSLSPASSSATEKI